MNALTHQPTNAPLGRPTTPALSQALQRLLDSEQSDDFAAGQIAGRDELRGEVIANLPVLRMAALGPAGEHGVMDVVGRRFALYPQPDRSDAEWAAWWGDYYEALAAIPLQALEAGMQAWVNDPKSEFMPKPGKLRDLAKTTPNRAAKHYTRAQKVAQLCLPNAHTSEPRRSLTGPTEAEKAQVKTMLNGFTARMAERSMAKPRRADMPSIAGKPDEGGLTPAMRAVMARRAEADL